MAEGIGRSLVGLGFELLALCPRLRARSWARGSGAGTPTKVGPALDGVPDSVTGRSLRDCGPFRQDHGKSPGPSGDVASIYIAVKDRHSFTSIIKGAITIECRRARPSKQ
jgi:hypothetical protein